MLLCFGSNKHNMEEMCIPNSSHMKENTLHKWIWVWRCKPVNPSAQEVEAGGSQVLEQPRLLNEMLSQNTNCWGVVWWQSAWLSTSKTVSSNPSTVNKTITKYSPQNRSGLRLWRTEPRLSRDWEAGCEWDMPYDQKCPCLTIQSVLFNWPIARIMLLRKGLLNTTQDDYVQSGPNTQSTWRRETMSWRTPGERWNADDLLIKLIRTGTTCSWSQLKG